MMPIGVAAIALFLAAPQAMGAPSITSVGYSVVSGTRPVPAEVKNGAPFTKPGIKGDVFDLCDSKPLPAGTLKAFLGSEEITNVYRSEIVENGFHCIQGRLPDKAMTGILKLVTSAGTATYPQPLTIDFAPWQSRCQMAAAVSAKWSNAQRSKLMVTLTFSNTGKYPCWVTPEDATGKYFVNGALEWWTDGKCRLGFTGGHAYLPPDLPGRSKTPLPVGKKLTTTVDVFSLPNYEKYDCPGTPAPKKLFVRYRAGHNEVSVESPTFEMPW